VLLNLVIALAHQNSDLLRECLSDISTPKGFAGCEYCCGCPASCWLVVGGEEEGTVHDPWVVEAKEEHPHGEAREEGQRKKGEQKEAR